MKNIWFTLSKDVYVSFNSMTETLRTTSLLYHTKTGKLFLTNNPHHIHLINEIYNPVNLGVVDMETYRYVNEDVVDFIDKTTQLGIGKILEKTTGSKPLNFLPILCLQNDIERLQQTNQEYLIGDKISCYLTSVTIVINNQCERQCNNCNIAYRQVFSCSKFYEGSIMPLETIKEIIVQSSHLNVKRVNIIGGDILSYPQWNNLIDFLKEYDFSYHLWINVSQIQNIENLLQLPFHKEINITFPFNESVLFELLRSTKSRNDFSYNFIIENMSHYESVNDIVNDFNISDYKILPLYNGENMRFFEENVFLGEEDILSGIIEMREIFCNQKLNSNFFGALIFLPDGTVNANMNQATIGKFPDESMLQLIYTELVRNTAWRKIRSGDKCSKCIYRFLCPPVSNYEMVTGKEDLCTFTVM
ncbi:MAG: TIGR04150 pseudo-rSAM protein [Bacteroidales bacterium]|jgi:pseudo-rSAM protein|nr:TIGR04150 pseudo-rSAM protein [Bacteroidales bacterium]